MSDKVVELKSGRPKSEHLPEASLWFQPLDTRLSQIERIVNRLEWQVWLILCGVGAIFVLTLIETLRQAG
jgi:hypothetical protein